MQKNQKSFLLNNEEAILQRKWYLIDAADKILGRLATRAASLLRGKHKAAFTPHVDCGDYVVVINADKIKLSGKKMDQKIYFTHSGYPGGHRLTKAKVMLATKPGRMFEHAVAGMLPKGRLGRDMIKKLKVVSGNRHKFAAQKPEKLEV